MKKYLDETNTLKTQMGFQHFCNILSIYTTIYFIIYLSISNSLLITLKPIFWVTVVDGLGSSGLVLDLYGYTGKVCNTWSNIYTIPPISVIKSTPYAVSQFFCICIGIKGTVKILAGDVRLFSIQPLYSNFVFLRLFLLFLCFEWLKSF